MNFKPTLWKSVVSISLPLLISFVKNLYIDACKGDYCSSVFELIIADWIIILGLIAIIYVPWSLFQKED